MLPGRDVVERASRRDRSPPLTETSRTDPASRGGSELEAEDPFEVPQAT